MINWYPGEPGDCKGVFSRNYDCSKSCCRNSKEEGENWDLNELSLENCNDEWFWFNSVYTLFKLSFWMLCSLFNFYILQRSEF